MQALGAEPEVGAAGTIEFTAHGKAYSLPMVVSGWYESFNDQLSQMAAAPSFAEAHPEMFQFTYNEDSDITDTYWSAIKVKSSNHLKEQLDNFASSIGGQSCRYHFWFGRRAKSAKYAHYQYYYRRHEFATKALA